MQVKHGLCSTTTTIECQQNEINVVSDSDVVATRKGGSSLSWLGKRRTKSINIKILPSNRILFDSMEIFKAVFNRFPIEKQNLFELGFEWKNSNATFAFDT